MRLTPTPNGRLRELRESKGLTQAEMASACGVGLRTYQLWESGRTQTPQERTLAGLYHLTGKSSPEEVGFHARPLSPISVPATGNLVAVTTAALRGHPPAAVTTMLASGRAARRIGTTELDRIRTRTHLLSGMYDQWGGGAVTRTALIDTMRHAATYLSATYVSDNARSNMWDAVAELSLIVAAMLTDHADLPTAQTTLLVGLTAARDAGVHRRALRGRILAQLVRQTLGRRDLSTALELLDLADSVAESQHLPTDVVALFSALRAGATGALGRLGDTRTLANRALDLHASARRPAVTRGEVTYEAGFGLACLELCAGLDVDHATVVLDKAIASFSPSQVRQRTHARTFRLLTLTERGDATTALHDVVELRTDVDTLRSARIRESLALTHLVPRVVRGEPEAIRVSTALHAFPTPLPTAFLRSRPSPTEVAAALHLAG